LNLFQSIPYAYVTILFCSKCNMVGQLEIREKRETPVPVRFISAASSCDKTSN
jgi:hypothetical protein